MKKLIILLSILLISGALFSQTKPVRINSLITDTTVTNKVMKACGITYPTADGTPGQIMKTDGSGVASFVDVSTVDAAQDSVKNPWKYSGGKTIQRTAGSTVVISDSLRIMLGLEVVGMITNIPLADSILKKWNKSDTSLWIGTKYDLALKQNISDTLVYDATKYDLDTLSSKKYKIEIINDSENNLSIPFFLKTTSTIYYNGFSLKDQQWSGIGSKTLVLNFVTGKYDYVYVLN